MGVTEPWWSGQRMVENGRKGGVDFGEERKRERERERLLLTVVVHSGWPHNFGTVESSSKTFMTPWPETTAVFLGANRVWDT